MTKLALVILFASALGARATAQTCSAYPNTLTNGTTADANQVMANFNSILACTNTYVAPISAPALTGNVSASGSLTVGSYAGGGYTPPSGGIMASGPIYAGSTGGDYGNSWQLLGRHDLNGPTLAGLINGATGANTVVQSWWITGTANSYLALTLQDNASAPYASMTVGSAVSAFAIYSNAFSVDSYSGASEFAINSSGRVGIGGAPSSTYLFYVNGSAGGQDAWNTTSDERLKTGITPITDGLAIVERLRPIRFRWRAPADRTIGASLDLPQDQDQVGFAAQQVAKLVPEAVSLPKDDTGVLGLKESKLIPMLVSAIQAQQREIDDLRARLQRLGSPEGTAMPTGAER